MKTIAFRIPAWKPASDTRQTLSGRIAIFHRIRNRAVNLRSHRKPTSNHDDTKSHHEGTKDTKGHEEKQGEKMMRVAAARYRSRQILGSCQYPKFIPVFFRLPS